MPRRFKPPLHTSGVFTPGSGEIRAGEDGILELPDEASEADIEALRRAGCVPEDQGPGLSVASYCAAYIRGEGRDDPAMLEFAVNNGPAIEAEFARLKALEPAEELAAETPGSAGSEQGDPEPAPEKAKSK